MINKDDLKVGDKVCYQPDYLPKSKWENGIVKEVPDYDTEFIKVVYHCNNDWDNYADYTPALTSIFDLALGWK